MKIKAILFFRSFEKKNINDSEFLQVNFLDESDKSFSFLFPFNEQNQKWLKMQKDTKVELELNLYEASNPKYRKYGLWVVS